MSSPSIFADVDRLRSASATCRSVSGDVGQIARGLSSLPTPAMPAGTDFEVRAALWQISRSIFEIERELATDSRTLDHTAWLFEESQRLKATNPSLHEVLAAHIQALDDKSLLAPAIIAFLAGGILAFESSTFGAEQDAAKHVAGLLEEWATTSARPIKLVGTTQSGKPTVDPSRLARALTNVANSYVRNQPPPPSPDDERTGECKAFVNNIVRLAARRSGFKGDPLSSQGGYYHSFANGAFELVSDSAKPDFGVVRPGDIIQIHDVTDPDDHDLSRLKQDGYAYPGMHTAIVVAPADGSPPWDGKRLFVLDSNRLPPFAHQIAHDWWDPNDNVNGHPNLSISIWRAK